MKSPRMRRSRWTTGDGNFRTNFFFFLFSLQGSMLLCYGHCGTANRGISSRILIARIYVYSLQGAVGLEAIRGTWVACRRVGVRARVCRKVRERLLRRAAAAAGSCACKTRGACQALRPPRGGRVGWGWRRRGTVRSPCGDINDLVNIMI